MSTQETRTSIEGETRLYNTKLDTLFATRDGKPITDFDDVEPGVLARHLETTLESKLALAKSQEMVSEQIEQLLEAKKVAGKAVLESSLTADESGFLRSGVDELIGDQKRRLNQPPDNPVNTNFNKLNADRDRIDSIDANTIVDRITSQGK